MEKYTTQEKVDAYMSVASAFSHLYKELKALGMKKPAETLSAGKVKFINRMLEDIKSFTQNEPESRYLDLLDDGTLPQYSDAILILSQYEGALSGFNERYFYWNSMASAHMWRVSSS